MCSAFAATLTTGEVSVTGILTDSTEQISPGMGSTVGGRNVDFVGTRESLANFRQGDMVVVEGETFRIRRIERVDDGEFLRLWLGS